MTKVELSEVDLHYLTLPIYQMTKEDLRFANLAKDKKIQITRAENEEYQKEWEKDKAKKLYSASSEDEGLSAENFT